MKDWRRNNKAVMTLVLILIILLLLGLSFFTSHWMPHKAPKPPCKHKVTSKMVTAAFNDGTSSVNTVTIDGVTASLVSGYQTGYSTWEAIIPVSDVSGGYSVSYYYSAYNGAPANTYGVANGLTGTYNEITVSYLDEVMK
ncbi:MAG TPA: hypothetical protein VK536_09815 [Candidatus Limnocylindrales bacterium]|nr:hypothetical protein [Candidatus Limnocylindrales bacterium]